MTKLEQIKKGFEELRELKKKPQKIAVDAATVYNYEREKIRVNSDLSTTGKESKYSKLQKDIAWALMKEYSEVQKRVSSLQDKLIKQAQAVILEPVKEPDAYTTLMFNREYEQFKADIALAPNGTIADRRIKDFFNKVEDPFFAQQIKSELSSLTNTMLSVGADKGIVSSAVDKLNSKSLTSEHKEAMEMLESVESSKKSELLLTDGMHHTHIKNVIGIEASKYVNKPDEYLSTYAD
ncbi:hypothetical protein [Bacillus altitudinis]|uniref:hypothetical protein n=1 Tax=Bacillus altitudinis TaxID=293387 RepID=UPI0025547D26|nr:hypothetical protein [Bacillus altitudinis]